MLRILRKKDKGSILGKCLLLLLILGATAASAQTSDPTKALNTLLSSPSLNKNQTTIYIWDLEADYEVVAYREKSPIVPASVMKCVSAAELQSCLSPNSRLTTGVYADGKISDGKLNGNVVVVGAGDPSLGDGRHKTQPDFIAEIVKALKDKGVKEIAGEIIIDDNLFEGPATHPSWAQGDLSQSYGTGCHAFNFEGNASGKAAIKNPSNVFIRKLKDALAAAQISLKGNKLASNANNRQLLLSYTSPTIGNLIRSCLHRSDNLYAETFLRLFGINNGTDGSFDNSAIMAMQHWDAKNYPVEGIRLVDGSGLSRDNRLTAEFLGTVLKELKDDPDYLTYFPLVGEEGTVRSFMKDTRLKGRMALKTGSMNGIQSYAGYVLDEDYMPTHVVVVMTNDLRNRENYRAALSKFFLSLF